MEYQIYMGVKIQIASPTFCSVYMRGENNVFDCVQKAQRAIRIWQATEE